MRQLLFKHKNAGKNGDVNVISVTACRSRKWSVTYGIGSVTDFAAAGNSIFEAKGRKLIFRNEDWDLE